MSATACRRCQTEATLLSRAKGDLAGVARRLARHPEDIRLRALLTERKDDLRKQKAQVDAGHNCDDFPTAGRT